MTGRHDLVDWPPAGFGPLETGNGQGMPTASLGLRLRATPGEISVSADAAASATAPGRLRPTRIGKALVLPTPVRPVVTRVSSSASFGPSSRATGFTPRRQALWASWSPRFPLAGASALAKDGTDDLCGNFGSRAGQKRRRMSSPASAATREGRRNPEGPDLLGRSPTGRHREPREGGGFDQSSLGVFLCPLWLAAGHQLDQGHLIRVVGTIEQTLQCGPGHGERPEIELAIARDR